MPRPDENSQNHDVTMQNDKAASLQNELDVFRVQGFNFNGTWECRHPGRWQGSRHVVDDVVYDGDLTNIRKWRFDGVFIIVDGWSGGYGEKLQVDVGKPNSLTGKAFSPWGHDVIWTRKK